MTLKQWANNGWLKEEPTSKEEVNNLFAIAYNAALKLCTILLRAEGYRSAHGLQHYRTLMAMPLVLGKSRKEDAEYLNTCRTKRNTVEYDYVGGVSEDDAGELLDFARELRREVLEWMKKWHPDLS